MAILQGPILTDFLYPFLLIFFIVFAILEKTNILGEDKKSVNAMVAMVVGLIFAASVFPKLVTENIILFLGVAMIVIFVGLLLWGFISGEGTFTVEGGSKIHKLLMWIFILGLVFGIIWAFGIFGSFALAATSAFSWLFSSSWSGAFWTNALFVFFISFAIAVAVGWNPFKGGSWFIKVK